MKTFHPNLFGKVCFVIFCILEYLFVVIPITKLLLTHYVIIDIFIWLTVICVCAYVSVELIWKLLNYLSK
jgi:hypothetical protein